MDETNYLDLIILKKIDATSTVEKFGTMINTSFFETANILGTLKVKGLIDIQSSMAGQSPIMLTGEGKETLEHASRKASEEIDSLDKTVLAALAGGVRDLASLSAAINLRPKDLAFRLNKLKVSDYIDYSVRSGKVMLSLSEKGFMLAGGARGAKVPPDGQAPAVPSASGAAKAAPSSSSTSSPAEKKPSAPPWAAFFGPKPNSQERASQKDIDDILASGANNDAPAPSTSVKPGQTRLSDASAMPNAAAKPQAAPEPARVPVRDKPLTAEEMQMARLSSKLEYYVQSYWVYALLLAILIALIVFAVAVASLPASG